MKIVAIVGSARLDGNTNYLVDKALGEAGRLGATTEKIVLSEYNVKPCLGHSNCSEFTACFQQDDMAGILKKVCEADGVILATPVYYFDVSAWMKMFIDRNYFVFRHKGRYNAKAVGLIVVGGGSGLEDTVGTLNRFVNSVFRKVPASNRFVVSGYARDPGVVKDNQELVKGAGDLGIKMLASMNTST